MASCCGSSNSSDVEDESGSDSSDIVSEADISSEDKSVESVGDVDDLSREEISALTRIYPPELDDRVEDNFSV